jgi:hypothetical protein
VNNKPTFAPISDILEISIGCSKLAALPEINDCELVSVHKPRVRAPVVLPEADGDSGFVVDVIETWCGFLSRIL